MPIATFIIVYFGKAPSYFPLFAHSASFITNAKFLIFSDASFPELGYDNIEIIHQTPEEFSKLASARLGIPVNILPRFGYKLCDFKSCYGLIFADQLKSSRYWGWCDMDLVFGNLNDYLTDDYLGSYDLFNCVSRYISGACCLLKNDEKMRALFQHSRDWRRVMSTTDKYFSFDECGPGNISGLLAGKDIWDLSCEVVSMTHVVRQLEKEGKIKPRFEQVAKEFFRKGEILHWTPGDIETWQSEKSQKYAFYHWVLEKGTGKFLIPSFPTPPNELFINRLGFHSSISECSSLFQKLYRSGLGLSQKTSTLPKRLLRKLSSALK